MGCGCSPGAQEISADKGCQRFGKKGARKEGKPKQRGNGEGEGYGWAWALLYVRRLRVIHRERTEGVKGRKRKHDKHVARNKGERDTVRPSVPYKGVPFLNRIRVDESLGVSWRKW